MNCGSDKHGSCTLGLNDQLQPHDEPVLIEYRHSATSQYDSRMDREYWLPADCALHVAAAPRPQQQRSELTTWNQRRLVALVSDDDVDALLRPAVVVADLGKTDTSAPVGSMPKRQRLCCDELPIGVVDASSVRDYVADPVATAAAAPADGIP